MFKTIVPSGLLVLLSAVLISCSSIKPVYQPEVINLEEEHLSKNVQAWEDGLRTNPEGNSFEWWYFDASLDDGSTAVIVFSTKSILTPAGRPDPQVSITITLKDGTEISASGNPKDDLGNIIFNASEKACDVSIGKSWVKSSPENLDRYELHFEGTETSGESVIADLILESEAPAWRPGTGKMYFDDNRKKYFAWLAAVPYANVRGSIEFKGTAKKVSGSGYHDHNWGNLKLDKVIKQWYWGRARVGEYTMIFSQILTASRYGNTLIPVFFLAKDRTILSDYSFEMKLEKSDLAVHSGGREYPNRLSLVVDQEDGTVEIDISDSQMIQSISLIESLSPIEKAFIRIFANPYYFRFKSNMEIKINLAEIEDQVTGIGVFEMMLLRGKHTY